MLYIILFMSYLLIILGVLISVAFIILLERKILGYIQLRKGPNKLGFLGILQSFRDAIKLFIKEQTIPSFSNLLIFYFSPVVSFIIVLLIWIIFPFLSNYINFSLGRIVFFCCTRFSVYSLIRRGWGSNSSYAMLGSIRGVAQTISYEVSIALIFLCVVVTINSFNIKIFIKFQNYSFWLISLFMFMFLIWFTSSLAETNRTPFDFAEGESELVSGFNIEYGRGGFALLFLAEYARIIFISYLIVLFFLGGINYNYLLFNLKGMILVFIFIWVRGTIPRFRYDKLIYLAWKSYLPLTLMFFMFYYFIKLLI